MFLFLRLVVGHLLGDFLFQTEGIVTAKREGVRGRMLHVSIIFASLLLTALPFLCEGRLWLVITASAVAHYGIDDIKIKIIEPRWSIAAFVTDQALHLLALAPVMLLPVSWQKPAGTNALIAIYNNNTLLVGCAGYLASGFAGTYLWNSIVRTFALKNTCLSKGPFMYGVIERALFTTASLGIFFLPLALLPCAIRLMSKRGFPAPEFSFNLIYACAIGILIRRFAPG
ncbi:MAG: DUF3307 domain-containing protein [Candidatus Omnitrophota bacterium]